MSNANDINAGNVMKHFFENLPDMDVSRSVTYRLINWIQEASINKTFTSVAEEFSVDGKTI